MATITSFGPIRHLRSDPNMFVLHYAKGKLRRSGRGLAYFFAPLSAGIAEVPLQENEVTFVISDQTRDFQSATVQGVCTYRFADPAAAADAINFTIDPNTGAYVQPPLEKIANFLAQLANGATRSYLVTATIEQAITQGAEPIRQAIADVLARDEGIKKMGMAIGSVRVLSVRATAELEKALQTPTREHIQQRADEATFVRRAQAVEKERAIKENELATQIELARRQQQLLEQQGSNHNLAARSAAEAAMITAKGEAERTKLLGETQAELDRERAELYAKNPRHVLSGLALMHLASKLQAINHLNVTPSLAAELFGDMLRKEQ